MSLKHKLKKRLGIYRIGFCKKHDYKFDEELNKQTEMKVVFLKCQKCSDVIVVPE